MLKIGQSVLIWFDFSRRVQIKSQKPKAKKCQFITEYKWVIWVRAYRSAFFPIPQQNKPTAAKLKFK